MLFGIRLPVKLATWKPIGQTELRLTKIWTIRTKGWLLNRQIHKTGNTIKAKPAILYFLVIGKSAFRFIQAFLLESDFVKIRRAIEVATYQMAIQQNDYWWWANCLFIAMPVMACLHKIIGKEQ